VLPQSSWSPIIVLAVTLGLTAAVSAYVRQSAVQRDQRRFEEAVATSLAELRMRMNVYADALHAGAALFGVDRQVSFAEFGRFVHRLELEERRPGVQGIGWAPRVEPQDRERIRALVPIEVAADFRIHPPGERPVYFPIVYLQPLDRRNRAALGFDMFSEPARRDAMIRARDTGLPAASAKVRLVQEIDSNVQAGFLIYVPVYATADDPGTVDKRRQALRGFIYSPFRGNDLLSGIFGSKPSDPVAFAVYDAPTPHPNDLLARFSHDAVEHRSSGTLTASRHLDVVGRRWTIVFSSTPRLEAHSQRHYAWYVAAGGILVSLLLAGITWAEYRARSSAELATQRLQASEEALRAANHAKDEFLAMLSHELRNPLGVVANALRLLSAHDGRSAEEERALDAAERQVRLQARLVDDLLDVSRISTGKIRLQRQPLDVNEVAARAFNDATNAAGDRRLTFHRGPPSAVVEADPLRLEQVINNLLGNALKFTESGGKIELEVRCEAGTGSQTDVVIEVRDDGIGIAPEAVDKVFDLFAQTAESRQRIQGGLGIGLTLVRRLVELHGGTVTAESPGRDRGSRFTVRLPQATGRPVTPAYPSSRSGIELKRAPDAQDRMRIVLVEDNADARTMMEDLLELLGHDVQTAKDGREGLETILKERPDIAIVDVGLPHLDGYEVATRVRAAPAGRELFVVALTGYGQAEDRRRALDSGFDEHLIKPLDLQRMRTVLDRARSRRSARQGEVA